MAAWDKYTAKYWRQAALAAVVVTAETLCDLAQPTIMAKIIDVGVAERRLDYVLEMGGLMLLLTGAGALAALLRNYLASHVSQQLGADLRLDVYAKIQTLSFDRINRLEPASLVTRVTNDVTQVQTLVNGLMRIALKAPLLCLGGLVLATLLNQTLAVVLAVVVPLVGVMIGVNIKFGLPRFARMQVALDRMNSVMREYLSGIRVVKAFNRFSYEVARFSGANEAFYQRAVSAGRAMAVFGPCVGVVVNIGIVTAFWLGGLGVRAGEIPVGHVVAFINYMMQIMFSLMIMSMVFGLFVRAKASAERLAEVLEQPSDEPGEAAVVWPAGELGGIVFDSVSFSYEGSAGEAVLQRINFSCRPGETIALIGATGSGKSTLVNLIPRFYEATAGTIRVHGVDISRISPRRLRETIAVVPQKTVLFTGTVLDNLKMGNATATQPEVERAARMAQAHEFIAAFPEGYQTLIGRGGVNLSGGQKQRIAIARALVRQPAILILDDCTSAVDVVTEAKIRDALHRQAAGMTVLVIAQRITSVMQADRIVVLDEGEIVGTGTHATLLQTCTVYGEIFHSQIGKEMQAYVRA